MAVRAGKTDQAEYSVRTGELIYMAKPFDSGRTIKDLRSGLIADVHTDLFKTGCSANHRRAIHHAGLVSDEGQPRLTINDQSYEFTGLSPPAIRMPLAGLASTPKSCRPNFGMETCWSNKCFG
jgi:hypothetical protein